MNFKPLFFILTALSLFAALSASYAENAEMAVLQGQYEKAFKERVTDVYETELSQLTANYFTGVERSIGEAKGAGDLETVLALEAESQRIMKKEPLPASDELAVKPLQKLRAIYRTELTKLNARHTSNQAALLTPYLARLKQLEVELTKTSRLAEAKEVMDYRVGMSMNGGTAAPSKGSKKPAKVQLVEATWVPLQKGEPVGLQKITWGDIPGVFAGYRFSKANGATLNFKVLSDGLVYMACSSRWGGGGSGGAWKEECVTQAQLEKLGWKPMDASTQMQRTDENFPWLVFTRDCKAGEELKYRTEKYLAPIILEKE